MVKNRYDSVISLGQDCACAEILRRCNLRARAYCFDWIRKNELTKTLCDSLNIESYKNIPQGDLIQRVDLICNDFEDYFNLDDFIILNTYVNSHGKRWHVINKRTGLEYLHNFLYPLKIEEQFESIKLKFDMRISRLYETISKSKKILFVYISRDNCITDSILIEMQKKLQLKFPNTRIDLLYVVHDSAYSIEDSSILYVNDNIIKFTLNYLHPTSTESDFDILLGNTEVLFPFLKDFCSSDEVDLHNEEKEVISNFLEQSGEKEYIEQLSVELKNKKIILYGAGLLTNVILEKYSFSKFNIIGISDKKFEKNNSEYYKGYKIIKPNELKDVDADVILVSLVQYQKIVNILKDSQVHNNFYPIIDNSRLEQLFKLLGKFNS